jgi:hypothetical protein
MDGRMVSGVGGADDKAVGVFDKELGQRGRLAAALLDVGGEDEQLDVDRILLAQCAGGILGTEVGGLVNRIALVASRRFRSDTRRGVHGFGRLKRGRSSSVS